MVKPLINGFQNFRDNYFSKEKSFFENLIKKGQKPKVMIISCSDSRVDPAILFNAKPGELFVVRNVANLVPPYEPDEGYHGVSAAIEYATKDLLVEHIVVLGHSECGGIKRLCEHKGIGPKRDFIDGWVSIAETAGATDLEGFEKFRHVERAAITVSLENLLTFPWLKQRVNKDNLELHGWFFDLEKGNLLTKTASGEWNVLA